MIAAVPVPETTMLPVGYLAKRVVVRPDWIEAGHVDDVFSVSGCVSKNFADYIGFWKHNGYWLFDSPGVISALSRQHGIDLAGTRLFYYEACDSEFDDATREWRPFAPEPSLPTHVAPPGPRLLEGYDVVTFSARTGPECSPLSCNGLATRLETNRHCLLPSAERARLLLEEGAFRGSEPGPYRVFAVYSTAWP